MKAVVVHRMQRISRRMLLAVGLNLAIFVSQGSLLAQESPATPPAPPAPADPTLPAAPVDPAATPPAVPASLPAAAPTAAESASPAESATPEGTEAPTDVEKALKQRKETAESKEKEKPKKTLTRDDYIMRPGAPRSALPAYRDPNPIAFKQPPANIMEQFDDLKSGKVQPADNDATIDAVAKFNVHRLTDPNPRAEPAKYVDDAIRAIPTEAGNRAKTAPFVTQYRKALTKYSRDLLDNSVLVRVNALLLLNRLNVSTNDVTEPVDVYLKAMEDPEQEDAVYFVALRGLDLAKENGTLGVAQERHAVELILKRAESKDVQAILLDQMIDTLGRLERAFKGDRPELAEVGTFLADIVADPSRDLRSRLRAAIALGSLKTTEVRGWNYELQSLLLAQMLRELIVAGNDGEMNKASQVYQWLVFELGAGGITKVYAAAKEDPEIADLYRISDPIIKQTFQRNAQVDPAPLEGWINKHKQPQSKKLAPGSVDVKLPG